MHAAIDRLRKKWSLPAMNWIVAVASARATSASISAGAMRLMNSAVAAALRLWTSSPMLSACAISGFSSIAPVRASTAARVGATTPAMSKISSVRGITASAFECSDPMVNRLFKNVVWTQRANFVEIPTDCPQRDERLGWTGDAQVFCRTAAFNMDVSGFFRKWLKDLAVSHSFTGAVPFWIPGTFRLPFGSSGWGDAATVVPWTSRVTSAGVRPRSARPRCSAASVDVRREASASGRPRPHPYRDW